MPDQVRTLHAKRVQEAKNVRDDKWPPIGPDFGWPGRLPEATEIWGDRPKACRSECGHLRAPEEARVGKAVQEQDGGTGSKIDHWKVLAPDLDGLGDSVEVHNLCSHCRSV